MLDNALTFVGLDDAETSKLHEHENNWYTEDIKFITDFDDLSDVMVEDSISQRWEK